MKKATIIEEVEQALARDLPDVDLVDVEVAGGSGNQVLRVFIDHADGVDHELCALVTGLLGCYQEDYTVEVSSPGLEKRLRKPEHFRDAVGQKINVKTFGPVEGRRSFTGFLFSMDGEQLELELEDGGRVTLPFKKVAMARTVFEFDQQETPRKKRQKKRD